MLVCERLVNTFNHRALARPLTSPLLSPLSADRNELEAAQKFLEQAAIENLVSMEGEQLELRLLQERSGQGPRTAGSRRLFLLPPPLPPSALAHTLHICVTVKASIGS